MSVLVVESVDGPMENQPVRQCLVKHLDAYVVDHQLGRAWMDH